MPPTPTQKNIEPNFFEIKDELNIVPAAGGSMMKGGQMQSPNFSAGVSGWRINAEGSAEFKNIIILQETEFAAGDTLRTSADTERSKTDDETYTKVKECQVKRYGTLRIKFDLKWNGGGGASNVSARIYKNGSAVGTERTTNSTTYVTYSEDISGWEPNDLCQLYYKTGGVSGNQVSTQNFRLYYDFTNEDLSAVNTD